MLLSEARGLHYVKAEHRRRLQPKLRDRTLAALEYKYRNISAVLVKMGLPYVDGYKPAKRHQGVLEEVIHNYVREDREIIRALGKAAAESVPNSALPDLKEETAPKKLDWPSTTPVYGAGAVHLHIDYLMRERENRRLGKLGEKAVVEFERIRLSNGGRKDLASRVEWTAREKGDGTGYDILSFKYDGGPLFIEVKTTKHAIGFPFFISAHEVAFSERHPDAYRLYRVFSFREQPRFYRKRGPVSSAFSLQPRVFEAWP